MKEAAEKAGLAVEKSMTVTSSDWLHYQWAHLVTRPGIGEASPFWAAAKRKTRAQSVGLRAFSILHRSKLNHVVTRLFDGIGLGDNRLYFLRKP
jgi:hypothetical protein